MHWLTGIGARVCVPIFHSPDYDLIAELTGRLLRVQVKTSSCREARSDRWQVSICTRGGNRSWSGRVKYFDPLRVDYLFVLVADGRRWFIPSELLDCASTLKLGGPKYADYELSRGQPLEGHPDDNLSVALESALLRGGAPE